MRSKAFDAFGTVFMEGKNEPQKRLEIRTMAKDIARLREKETDKQRDKIVAIKTEVVPQKIDNAKNLKTEGKPKIDLAQKEKEELKRKIEEAALQQKQGEEQRKSEEIMLRAEMEAKETSDLAAKIREATEKRKMEEKLKEEEMIKQAQAEAAQKEESLLRQKQEEEKATKMQEEMLLVKQKKEKLKLEQEEQLKAQREQEKARLAELLNKVKGPVDRLRERMQARKEEKTMSAQRPGLEEKFFKKSFGEKKEEIAAEPQPQKSPEQLMIEKLQRIEAQREKERQERQNFLQRVTEEKIQIAPEPSLEETPATRFPLMSKAPLKKIPSSEKIWVRILVLGVLFTVWGILITFNYWANVARKPIVVPQTPAPETQTPTPVLSQSFIPVTDTALIKFDTLTELKTKLASSLKESYPEGEIRRIAFGDNQKKQYLTTEQMFEDLGVVAPPVLFQKIDSDFTFFLYSKEAYNRFGIIMKVKNREDLSTLTKGWEPSMEDDLDVLFSMIGKQKPAIVPYFRTSKYENLSFRFQTFGTNDIGICYITMGDYFILTSSFESMTKVIDLLK